MKNYILSILLFSLSLESFGQTEIKVIKIDMVQKTITPSVLPFDRPILLEVKSKNYKLGENLFIYEVKTKRGRKFLGETYKRNVENILIKPVHEEAIKVFMVKEGEYRATIPYLMPNMSYDLVFDKKLSPKELKIFFKYYDNVKNGETNVILDEFYKENILGLESLKEHSPYEQVFLGDEPIDVGNISMSADQFREEYHPNMKRIIDDLLNNLYDCNKPAPDVNEIRNVGKYVIENKLDKSLHSLLYDFTEERIIKKIVLGLKVLGDRNKKAVKINDLLRRKSNIEKSLKLIDSIDHQLIKLISIEDPANINLDFRTKYINGIRETISQNKGLFENAFEEIEEFLNPHFTFVELVSAASINSEMETTNGQIIVPDFGLMNILAFENDGTTRYIPRATAGINLHFGGGIDRNKRIRNIPSGSRQRFWLRSSIAVGVTIGKIEENGFTDFYNGFSPSIGYNYRLEDQIRIGGGMILIRELDSNPVISKSKIEPALYLNLTFDFKLFSTMGKAASKIVGL